MPVGDEVPVAAHRAGHIAGLRRGREAIAIAVLAAVLKGEDEIEAVLVGDHLVIAGHRLFVAIAAHRVRPQKILAQGIGANEILARIEIQKRAADGADARCRNRVAGERLPLDDAVHALHRARLRRVAQP